MEMEKIMRMMFGKNQKIMFWSMLHTMPVSLVEEACLLLTYITFHNLHQQLHTQSILTAKQ